TTTIVFVNNRSATERLTHLLNERAGADIALAHHGSLSRVRREQVEDMLKSGAVRAIVATSSLELGIDMGSVDLVVQIESPGAVSRGLQRVGRAGHGVGEVSKGIMFPKYRGDLLECAATARGMLEGALEPVTIQRNALDVLAQQIVAMCAVADRSLPKLLATVRRAYGYSELTDDVFIGVIDMLSGRYPSTDFAELRPRLTWDRTADMLSARKGARLLAMTNAGTIPDRGLYRVHIGPEGPRIGELDEEMVYEARTGQTFILGASTWRIDDITADRVIVSPAPGEPGQLPFWRGAGPGRPIALGQAMGQLLRELGRRNDGGAQTYLAENYPLDGRARGELIDYVREQQAATGKLPDDKTFIVERFRDEIGDVRVCILSLLGSAVNAPWAMALEATLSRQAGFEVSVLWSDDGISLRFTDEDMFGESSVDAIDWSGIDRWIVDPDEVEELLTEQLAHTALFAGIFRESASRALLLPRRRPGKRTPLWAQRQKSQRLLAVARQFPAFPIVLESYRECMKHVFDLDALKTTLRALQRRELKMVEVTTERASPFARSLVFDYVAAWLYEGDAPLAERRAQALTLDKDLLRELLGHAELRDLLDPGALAEVEAELQGLVGPYRAHGPDELHDLLRRIGDLSDVELAKRVVGPHTEWLVELSAASRTCVMRINNEDRTIAAEDAGLYRDALGSMPPQGLPMALVAPVDGALRQLVVRFSRTHGPFTTRECSARWGLRGEQVSEFLTDLQNKGELTIGELRPGGVGSEWCDADVLRRIRRRSIAAVRGTIAPVAAEALARFLPAWHAIGDGVRIEDALARLEGAPIAFSELESRILKLRTGWSEPGQLDLLTQTGQWVWVGDGAHGAKDGRIRLYQRSRAALLHVLAVDYEPPEPVHRAILDHLANRGASFLFELTAAVVANEGAAGRSIRNSEVLTALWDLVWAGQITNDTLAPLRQLGVRSTARRPRSGGGGRWSLVSDLFKYKHSVTEREHARALLLIERHGVLSRDSMAIEDVRGGFSAIYPVLRALEEVGRIRRGYFVEGLAGVQFAAPGAVDRLRSARDEPKTLTLDVLAATDPASPYGSALSWPESSSRQGGKREVGSSIVLVNGTVWAWLSRSGRHLNTFEAFHDDSGRFPGRTAETRTRALKMLGAAHPKRPIQIERIDGESALSSPVADLLTSAGFDRDYKGLRYAVGVR
ncbi:MAG: ATP-dependent Lhr-like helicase, partial [Myxococcota bacterium]